MVDREQERLGAVSVLRGGDQRCLHLDLTKTMEAVHKIDDPKSG